MQSIRTKAAKVRNKLQIFAGLVLLTLAPGQLAALSASRDGSVVVFAENNKIVRWQLGRGADLVGDRDRIAPVINGSWAMVRFVTNAYRLSDPQVSADGRTVRYVAQRQCWNRCNITFPQVYAGVEWTDGEEPRELDSAINVSPDGRFLRSASAIPGLLTFGMAVRDRLTGAVLSQTNGRTAMPVSGRLVANDGTAIGEPRQILRADGREVLLADTAGHLALTADGQAVIFAQRNSVRRRSLNGSIDTVLYEGSEPVSGLDISDDGSVVLVKTLSGQAILVSAGSVRTVAASGVKAVAVAGNGAVAFLQPEQGPLLRLVLTNGAVREEAHHWYPLVRTAWRGVAGSQVRLAAAGLYPGVSVKAYLNGVEAPVVDPNPTELRLQIPWEFATRPAGTELSLVIERDGVVTSRSVLTLTAPQPEFVGYTTGTPLVYRDDQVTPGSHFADGELGHATVLGLGPADAPLATGQPSPVDPLARTQTVNCVAVPPGRGPEEPVDLHYAGLIPNEVGLYRISLRIPYQNTGTSGFSMRCRVGEGPYATLDLR